ncbi:MAG TPA: Uma2 family endonuclease [Thermoanaerobaculia bacterium]|nr:Uma2 family endonuclease [Thermoanaerobaculia bacterium]
MASTVAVRLTYEDYLELPNDGKRYEIIDGELYVNPAPVPLHQIIIRQLLRRIQDHLDTHGGGEAIGAPIDVVLGRETVVQPDVIVVLRERVSIIGPTNVNGAPDLVIEVLSQRTRSYDETAKRKVYEQAGVKEYWIVDPERTEIRVHRGGDVAISHVGGTITSPLMPGFVLELRYVFRA